MKIRAFAFAAIGISSPAAASPLTVAIQSGLAAGCAPWIARQNYPDVAPRLAKQGWQAMQFGGGAVHTREGPWGYVMLQLNTNADKYSAMSGVQRDALLRGPRPTTNGADYDAAKAEKRKCSLSVRVAAKVWTVAAERAAMAAWVAKSYPQSTPAAARTAKITENFTMSVTAWKVPKGFIAIAEAPAKAPDGQFDLMFVYEESLRLVPR